MDGFKLEALGGGITAVISDDHSFGTDAVLLASFTAPKKNDIACDMGSGCGIIPLIWCRDGLCKSITALEIQRKACEQIKEAVKLNGLSEKLFVVCGDLRDGNVLPEASFDVVSMNPPYKAPMSGKTSITEAALMARHEVTCKFSDAAKAASKLLKFGGRFCVCHRPERLADVVCAMRDSGIELKRIRTVAHKAGARPSLILAEGKKGAKAGTIIEPVLVLKDENGNYTDEALDFYGLYRNDI
ncbi:MAG: methyltransferase [Clostridiales bacterium]|nr:methyltransferase [Clostridiales bacterium]